MYSKQKSTIYSLERTTQSCIRTLFALLLATLKLNEKKEKFMYITAFIAVMMMLYYNTELYYYYNDEFEEDKDYIKKMFVMNNILFITFFLISNTLLHS